VEIDFWQVHGLGFILCMCFFPRLTMLFSTTVGAGPLYWFGWVFAPRLTVAILATSYFWHTNTILCVFAWFWALVGEVGEKEVAVKVT
jgi:hypothetical protein